MLNLEDFTKKTNEILASHTEQGRVSELLAEILTDYTSTVADVEKLNSDVKTVNESNEKLRNANMNLFLQLGGKSQPINQSSNQNNNDPKPLSLNDVLDGKGRLR